MENSLMISLWIAQLMGPVLLVAALGMIMNRHAYVDMARQFTDNTALIYLAGVITLTLGLAVTLSHNVWIMGWPVIITIFGWLAIVGGVFRMAFPNKVAEFGTSMIEKYEAWLPLTIIIVGLLGAVLTFYGYMA